MTIPEIIAEIRKREPVLPTPYPWLLALCDSHDALEKALAATESDYMAVRRSLLAERDSLKEALAGLMSYYPQYVTPDFRAAFEAAKKLTHENQDYK